MSSVDQNSQPQADRRWNVAPRQEIAGRNATRQRRHVVLLKYILFAASVMMVSSAVSIGATSSNTSTGLQQTKVSESYGRRT